MLTGVEPRQPMRFKNRYLLMELVWRDGKTASHFSEWHTDACMKPVQHCIMWQQNCKPPACR